MIDVMMSWSFIDWFACIRWIIEIVIGMAILVFMIRIDRRQR